MERAEKKNEITTPGCAVGILSYFIGLPVTMISTSFVVSRLVQKFLLSAAYGPERYANGLRIVDRQMHLSDGTMLPGKFQLIYVVCVFLRTALAVGFVYFVITKFWAWMENEVHL